MSSPFQKNFGKAQGDVEPPEEIVEIRLPVRSTQTGITPESQMRKLRERLAELREAAAKQEKEKRKRGGKKAPAPAGRAQARTSCERKASSASRSEREKTEKKRG